MGKVLTAFAEEQVAQLTGITVGRLRYWDRTEFFQPEFAYIERRDAFSRVYSYLDVVSLRIIARLRKDVPLQRLRAVKEELATFSQELWRGLTLWVQNREVAFINPNTGEPEEVVSGQKIMKLRLAETLDELEERLRVLLERDPTVVGTIEQHRRVMHNRPVIAGTRIPVSAIRSFKDAGYSTDDIIAEYPSLTVEDVEAAVSEDHAA